MNYDTNKLITSVTARSQLPDFSLFSRSDILALASEELRDKALPYVLKQRADFCTFQVDYPLQSTDATGFAYYDMPYRALGGKLRAAYTTDLSHSNRKTVPVYLLDDVHEQLNGGAYIQGDRLILTNGFAPPQSTGYLRLVYYMRPSELVTPEETTTILSVVYEDDATATVTLDAEENVGLGLMDVHSPLPNFQMRGIDMLLEPAGAGSFFLTGSNIRDVKEGDVICKAGQSSIPLIPAEAHGYLYGLTVVRLLQAQGDKEALKDALNEVDNYEARLKELLSVRNEGNAQTLTNRHLLGV